MINKIISKKELLLIGVFLVIIFLLFYSSIVYSRMRERDLIRQKDLAAIQNALNVFRSSYRFYPPSENGNILACAVDGSDFNIGVKMISISSDPFSAFSTNALECKFGKDYLLSDLSDANTKVLNPIPSDPLPDRQYNYISDGNSFAILADMETNTVEDYDGIPKKFEISCGFGICDYIKGNMILDNLR